MQNLNPTILSRNSDLLCEFANKSELAGLFGVSPRTIERWVHLRAIPKPVRLGRQLFFHLPTIREALIKAAASEPRQRPRANR